MTKEFSGPSSPMRWVGPLILAAVLSGCVDADGVLDNGRTVIAEDQYYQSKFEFSRAATLSINVDVHSGPNIDVIVVDDLNFQQFRAGNAFVHFTSCGGVAAQGFSRSCSLNPGIYVIVLDNTDAGTTVPPMNGVDDGADTSWAISAA